MVIRESDLRNSGMARALWAGVIVAVLGGVAWGLLIAYAELQSWLLAIAIGAAIGWIASRFVEKPTMAIQVAVVVLTLGSVFLGQILGMAFAMLKEFDNFDLPLATDLYFDLLRFDDVRNDLLFALGGGAIGAFYAVRMIRTHPQAPAPPPPS